jgi:hypothetical protein
MADVSLKPPYVLRCLGNLFIISVLQNCSIPAVPSTGLLQRAVWVAGSQMTLKCRCIGTVVVGGCQTVQGGHDWVVKWGCFDDVGERGKERDGASSKFFDHEKLYISNDIGLWAISVPKQTAYCSNWSHLHKIEMAVMREGVNRDYSDAFCLEKRDLNSGVCSDSCSYCWRDNQTYPDSDLRDEDWFC